MIHAYLLINLKTDIGNEEILDEVKKIPQVKEAYRLYGTYDLIILLEGESPKEIKDVTLESIRKLKYVESTMTMISLNSYVR